MSRALLIFLFLSVISTGCKDNFDPAHPLDESEWVSVDSISVDSLHFLLHFTSNRLFWYTGPLPCYDAMELLLNVQADTLYVGLPKDDETEETPNCSYFLYQTHQDSLILTLGTLDGCVRIPRGGSDTFRFVKTKFTDLDLCKNKLTKK